MHSWLQAIVITGTRGGGEGARARGGAMREGGHTKMPSLRYPTLYNTIDL